MKIKKVIALGVSAMMMLSSIAVVSAANEEYLERQPKVAITVGEQITDIDTYKLYTDARGATNRFLDDKYDYYLVTVDLTDLGSIYNNDDGWAGVAGFNVGLKTDGIVTKDGTTTIAAGLSGQLGASSIGAGQGSAVGQTEYFNLMWTGTTGDPYPGYGDAGNAEDNGSMSVYWVLPVAEGASVTIDEFKVTVTYDINNTNVQNNNAVVTTTPVVIGQPVTTSELDMTVGFEGKYGNGYVWEANITQGENAIDSFTAKFTADTEVANRAVTNVADMASKFTGGQLSFNIGLDTTKTLTGAEFTVGAGAESKTVVAPLE